jgi:hypothetical protein
MEAYKDGSAAGCGGVIRDSHGGWIGGFAKYLGLRYVRNLGLTRIELNVDASVVDRVLRRQGNNSPTRSALINQIMYYESCPSECHLVWSDDVLGIAIPRLILV